jgi:starch synthase (maltosyl-transferring)
VQEHLDDPPGPRDGHPHRRHEVWVDRPRRSTAPGTSSSPRSEGPVVDGTPTHGTFATAAARLPAIAEMGFDVVYLPPIHPIGTVNRKGPTPP